MLDLCCKTHQGLHSSCRNPLNQLWPTLHNTAVAEQGTKEVHLQSKCTAVEP